MTKPYPEYVFGAPPPSDITRLNMTKLRRRQFNGEIYFVGPVDGRRRHYYFKEVVGPHGTYEDGAERHDPVPLCFVIDVRHQIKQYRYRFDVSDLNETTARTGMSAEEVIALWIKEPDYRPDSFDTRTVVMHNGIHV